MGRLIYKKQTKIILTVVQVIAACVLTVCLLNIRYWLGDSFSLSELSRGFEESERFFRQVDTILSQKIRGQDNEELFETDGTEDLYQEIDIQSYGTTSVSVQDMNTTYELGDLLTFCESGDQEQLHNAIQTAMSAQSADGQSAGELLDAQADLLETITPVTGISLAECSRWYSDSAGFVLEMYTKLDEVSSDIYRRYQEYTEEQDETWSDRAPSNLLYCIENTATGELYTNTGAADYDSAVSAAGGMEEYSCLYEGERSYNILVSDPEHVLNEAAAQWFQEERFTGTNEKVYLAVNTNYPVNDTLRTAADSYSRRENFLIGCGMGAAAGLFFLIGSFVLTVLGAGWQEGQIRPGLLRMDRVPVEMAAGVYLILAVTYLLLGMRWKEMQTWDTAAFATAAVLASTAWLVFLSACMSLARRIRSGTLLSDSVTRMLLHTWRSVHGARAASGQLLLMYIAFFVLNFLFLLLFGRIGLVLVVLLDIAVLLYLLRDIAGKQSIYEGIHQLSRGDLSYRIDTSSLWGEPGEMARAVNEMGESLGAAVEAIVKNERLKSELITNVSHDLKTPLTSIVNYVDLLKRENLEGERVQHYIEVLDQKSQRLRQLTEDLVEASKISSGNVELEMVQMQLQSMLKQACGEFEERFEERGLSFAWELPEEPVYILADGRQLWRILENLLGNINKYAKENTVVRVGLVCEGGEVTFFLENVSREPITVEADELTGRFVRGDQSRSTEGSGLGLSIAQSLAVLLGGRLKLHTGGELFIARVTFPVFEDIK